jgi:predicted transposase/invertase (TIGR01784 family)
MVIGGANVQKWLYNFFSEPVPPWVTELSQLQEVPTMLATTLKQWEQDLVQQGLQQGLYKGKQEGLQEGLQQGLLEGEKRKARETARKLKSRGMALQEIAELTGLSLEEVRNL